MISWRALLDARRQRHERRGACFYRALSGMSVPPLPRFHVDRFGSLWIATFASAPGDGEDAKAVASLLAESAGGVVFRSRDETRKGHMRARVVSGACPEKVIIEHVPSEHAGYRFEVRPLDEIDPGAYPDSEPLREALRLESARKRVLNLFAFTCLNGVVARLAGARSVVNVDLARSHLERGKTNYALNGLSIDDRDFVAADALKWCAKAERARWDLIVVDPPPLLRRGRGHVPSEEHLEETLAAVLPLAAHGATIHFLQVTARVSAEELHARVSAVCPAARVSVHAASVADLDARELPPTFKDAVIRIE